MRAFIAMVASAACAACAAPMVASVDLKQASEPVLTTYGVGVTELQIRQLPYGGDNGPSDACKAALEAYDVARGEFDVAAAPYVRARGDVLRFVGDLRPVGRARALSAQQKRWAIAEIKAAAALAGPAQRAEEKATLAERRVEERCPDEQARIEVLAVVKPSTSLLYGLVLQGGAMSDDALKIETGADGLLTSVTATSNDRTSDAVVSVAQLIGRFSAQEGFGIYPTSPPPLPPRPALAPSAAEVCGIALLPPSRRLAEAERRLQCVDANDLLKLAYDLLPDPGYFPDLRPGPPAPAKFYVLDDMTGAETYADRLNLDVTCVEPLVGAARARQGGIVVATPTPCRLIVRDEAGTELANFAFVGMRSRHLTVVPVERAALVTNSTTLTFRNGALTTVDVTRPSSGAAIAGLPGKFINGLVSGVVDAFKDSKKIEDARVEQMQAETTRIEAEAARIAQPTPAWTDRDTAYVQAQGVVATRQATYDAALAAEEPDPAAIATAAAELRNAKALANAAAVAANRPLPYPDLI